MLDSTALFLESRKLKRRLRLRRDRRISELASKSDLTDFERDLLIKIEELKYLFESEKEDSNRLRKLSNDRWHVIAELKKNK